MRRKKNIVMAGDRQIVVKRRHSWSDMSCALPAVILLTIMTYYPLAKLVEVSFTDWNLIQEKKQVILGRILPKLPAIIVNLFLIGTRGGFHKFITCCSEKKASGG